MLTKMKPSGLVAWNTILVRVKQACEGIEKAKIDKGKQELLIKNSVRIREKFEFVQVWDLSYKLEPVGSSLEFSYILD